MFLTALILIVSPNIGRNLVCFSDFLGLCSVKKENGHSGRFSLAKSIFGMYISSFNPDAHRFFFSSSFLIVFITGELSLSLSHWPDEVKFFQGHEVASSHHLAWPPKSQWVRQHSSGGLEVCLGPRCTGWP